ncbi:MAG TPA: 4-hydroxy-tetrahydrodipicolinate synthase [Candidatus Binataceae bacterium]|jgi:4-hydroxy-tetrahydrodipicolinate synthase|nr:4-hydroxy-tetrahydrodipicolinate synthase [Candidatus Binataceae bacterium]
MFTGALSAIVTPFNDGAVDEVALRDLIEWQISAGVAGIVPCGSTGESATLSHAEHEQVIKIAIEQTKKRVPVVAGTGSNSTAEAIRLTAAAREMGADAALLISPYYNKPTQEGIYKHYKMIAQSVDLPLIIYNIPGRTGSNIMPETMARLCEVRNIVGVKEASGSMDQISDIRRLCGDRLTILSGDDALTLPLIALGAKGVISVITNIMPREMGEMACAALEGNYTRAREIHYRMLPLMRALFIETNPIPIKHAMSLLKKCSPEVRMPLTPMSPPAADKLKAVMKEMLLL